MKAKKPRIDIGEDWTIELERDWVQVLGERQSILLKDQVVTDNSLCDAAWCPGSRVVELLKKYPTLDAFGTGFWEEWTHAFCSATEIDLPHEKQVLLAHGIWLASATLHDTDWWR